uniref:Immunoglobulin V-set domain-containing protein n=1 Tax=Cyclopterus lumpus TaxID=8103 RepID=A0A8C3G3L3_CYCLU
TLSLVSDTSLSFLLCDYKPRPDCLVSCLPSVNSLFCASSCQSVTSELTSDFPVDYFFWYRQHPGKPPEFLISHLASGGILRSPTSGLEIEVDQSRILMNISSAAVTDSAVYYCALRPTVTGNTQSLYKNTS